MKKAETLAIVAFLTVCIVWGTTYLGIRVAVESVPPFLMTGIRYTIGGTSGTRVTITAGGPSAPYAPFIEFGTTSMRQQPFFFPGWRASQKKVRSIVNKAIRNAVRKAMT